MLLKFLAGPWDRLWYPIATRTFWVQDWAAYFVLLTEAFFFLAVFRFAPYCSLISFCIGIK